MNQNKKLKYTDKQFLKEIALSIKEYQLIVSLLKRTPSKLELGLFGALWSEHCGYKHTKSLIKTLPTKSKNVLIEAGKENAGAVNIGDGYSIVMKIESHNHPSAVEPKQGAATGVGGIVRDIIAMGAYPIALLNSLRFGPINKKINQYLLSGVVEGISSYGNCLGIPDIGGEIEFEECYTDNPIVNAMCVGILKDSNPVKAIAQEPGDLLLLVGSKTGRDGIHGASGLASQSLDSDSELRTAVQIANPFLEKKLIEACFEACRLEGVVGMQDLGAAGLTSAAIEVAHKSNLGLSLDVSRVPVREKGMSAYEIMLSESQERMILIVKKEYNKNLNHLFSKWDLESKIIGSFIKDKKVEIYEGDNLLSSTPIKYLVEAPSYKIISEKPKWLSILQDEELSNPKIKNSNAKNILKSLLSSSNISSKEYIFQQYDHQVQTNTIISPGEADASVIQIKGTSKGIALSTDCDSKKCYLDPYIGAMIAVAESCRNVSCVGATPLAITDGLNLGNPEKKDVQFQLSETIKGLKDACNKLDVPVISGNASLYNESNNYSIYPTPIIGSVGLINDFNNCVSSSFKEENDIIIAIGNDIFGNHPKYLAGSEFQKIIQKKVSGKPLLDLDFEKILQKVTRELVTSGLVNSSHDCSSGGLAVAISECCALGNIGAKIDIPIDSWETPLFGENKSMIIFSANPKKLKKITEICNMNSIPCENIGVVKSKKLIINNIIEIDLKEIHASWSSGFNNL